MQIGKKEREQRNDGSHRQAARHAACHITGQDHMIGHRGDQQLFNVLPELGTKKGGDHIRVGVGDHRHHDQPRHHKLDVVKTAYLANARADQLAEDNEIERHGDGGRQGCFCPRL